MVAEGIVIIAQEGRFEILDDAGVGHLFAIAPSAGAEPQQMDALQRDQARVRVHYRQAKDAIGHVATRVETL